MKLFQSPVIAAGGILTGADIAKAFEMGASGVQMGTRFVASEVDAPLNFKQRYVDALKKHPSRQNHCWPTWQGY